MPLAVAGEFKKMKISCDASGHWCDPSQTINSLQGKKKCLIALSSFKRIKTALGKKPLESSNPIAMLVPCQ